MVVSGWDGVFASLEAPAGHHFVNGPWPVTASLGNQLFRETPPSLASRFSTLFSAWSSAEKLDSVSGTQGRKLIPKNLVPYTFGFRSRQERGWGFFSRGSSGT